DPCTGRCGAVRGGDVALAGGTGLGRWAVRVLHRARRGTRATARGTAGRCRGRGGGRGGGRDRRAPRAGYGRAVRRWLLDGTVAAGALAVSLALAPGGARGQPAARPLDTMAYLLVLVGRAALA